MFTWATNQIKYLKCEVNHEHTQTFVHMLFIAPPLSHMLGSEQLQ